MTLTAKTDTWLFDAYVFLYFSYIFIVRKKLGLFAELSVFLQNL